MQGKREEDREQNLHLPDLPVFFAFPSDWLPLLLVVSAADDDDDDPG